MEFVSSGVVGLDLVHPKSLNLIFGTISGVQIEIWVYFKVEDEHKRIWDMYLLCIPLHIICAFHMTICIKWVALVYPLYIHVYLGVRYISCSEIIQLRSLIPNNFRSSSKFAYCLIYASSMNANHTHFKNKKNPFSQGFWMLYIIELFVAKHG